MGWLKEFGSDLREAVAEIKGGINYLAGKISNSPPGCLLALLLLLSVEHLCLFSSFKFFSLPYNWLISAGVSASMANLFTSVFFGFVLLGSVRIGLAALGLKLCSITLEEAGVRGVKSAAIVVLAALAGPIDVVLRSTVISLFKYKTLPVLYLSTGELWGKFSEPMFYYWLIFGCLAAPMIEEFFFRGFLQTVLEKRIGGKKAVVATAFLFAVMHNPGTTLEGFAIRFVKGLIFSALKKWEGTLWAPVAAHSVNNFAAIFFPIVTKLP